jgi:hypothetical protein
MNKLQLSTLIAAISLTGGLYANAQTAGGQTSATPGTTNPMPATNPAEGTAADSTPPGKTPVRGTAASQAPGQATTQDSEQQNQQNSDDSDAMTQGADNAIPATRRAEGTAADTTAPGKTPVRGAAASRASEQATGQGSESQSQQSTGSQTSSSERGRTRTAEGTPDRSWQAPKTGTEDRTQTEADSTQTDSGTQGE